MAKMIIDIRLNYNEKLVMDAKDVATLTEIFARSKMVTSEYLGEKGHFLVLDEQGCIVRGETFPEKTTIYTLDQFNTIKETPMID